MKEEKEMNSANPRDYYHPQDRDCLLYTSDAADD